MSEDKKCPFQKDDEGVSIQKVVLNICGKTIELSVEEARDLKNVLNNLFGSPYTTTYVPTWYSTYPTYSTYTITCGSSDGILTCSTNQET